MYVTHTEKVELVDFKICYAQYHGHNWSDTCLRSWSHPDLSLHQGCTLPLSHIYLWNTFSPSLLPLTGALVMNSSGWGHWAQRQDMTRLILSGVESVWGWVAAALTQSALRNTFPQSINHAEGYGGAAEGYSQWQGRKGTWPSFWPDVYLPCTPDKHRESKREFKRLTLSESSSHKEQTSRDF